MPWISTRNRKPKYGSCAAIAFSLLSCAGFLQGCSGDVLDHLEDDEFSRRGGHDRDFDNHDSLGPEIWRVQSLIHTNAECQVWGRAEQRALLPLLHQKTRHHSLDLLPQRQVVGFKYREARPILDGFFDERHQAANVDETPGHLAWRRDGAS